MLVNQYFPYQKVTIPRTLVLGEQLVFVEDRSMIVMTRRWSDMTFDYYMSEYDIKSQHVSMYIGGEDVFQEIFRELNQILLSEFSKLESLS